MPTLAQRFIEARTDCLSHYIDRLTAFPGVLIESDRDALQLVLFPDGFSSLGAEVRSLSALESLRENGLCRFVEGEGFVIT